MKRRIGPKERARGIWAMAAMAPVAVVQLARLAEHAGPATASASIGSATSPPTWTPPTAEPPPTPEQAKAAEWIRAHREAAVAVDPFSVGVAPIVVQTGREPEAAPMKAGREAPELKISGFMGKGDSAMVTINRRVRRVGDEVAPGWRVVLIDAAGKTVRVRHADGTSMEIEAAGKGEK